MEDFAGSMRRRLREARQALQAAMESGDAYEMQVRSADLEDILRLAAEHGIAVDGERGA
ncbi:hypothetical protein [Nonomuraea sp. B19D2]|uniref:hypothetical protein n=1 Tax=Nonomuraea sp. B19D2 TaxID=3159561 RepID=UPI0032DAC0A5